MAVALLTKDEGPKTKDEADVRPERSWSLARSGLGTGFSSSVRKSRLRRWSACANTLWKYVHRFGYPPENARQDVADLRALVLMTVSTADLLEPALELAMAYDISTYDASYAALAAQLDLPLITADVSLARRLQASGVKVRTLEEMRDT